MKPSSADSGALAPNRAFARVAGGALTSAELTPDGASLGGLVLDLSCRSEKHAATWTGRVTNRGHEPVRVDAVGIGFRWVGVDSVGFGFFGHGYQSWSNASGGPLDDTGTEPFPSAAWLRGFHHVLREPAADRGGWHESDGVAALGATGAGPVLVAGVLETGRTFGVVYLRRDDLGVRVEVEQRLEVPLEPGASFELEAVRFELGHDAAELLARFADAQGRAGGARTDAAFQTGWCSWYHYFLDVDEEVLLRNLDALAGARDELPVDVFQLDGGYQSAYGDWLETNDKFPSGLERLAARIRDAGFTPGIWTAPFCVVPEAKVFAEHPDWLLRRGTNLARCLYDRAWTPEGWIYTLDPTHPEVLTHLEEVFATTVSWGFAYQKLDFLYSVALEADAHDPTRTRAQRLRDGLQAIRRGVGEETFLLGCGCPLGPAVGVVDGMRIGPDTGPWWAPLDFADVPGVEPTLAGLEPTVPAGANALRNTLARAWMHRRLWLNDPDCLMVRDGRTRLSADETRALAGSIAATGGMTILSDDVTVLEAEQRAMVRETIAIARETDAAIAAGSTPVIDLLTQPTPTTLRLRTNASGFVFAVNVGEQPATVALGGGEPRDLEPLLGSAPAEPDGPNVVAALGPHDAALYRDVSGVTAP